MTRQKGIHKSLKIRTPPLRQRIAYFPIFIDAFTTELGADGSQAFIEPGFEAGYFVVIVVKVISRPVHNPLAISVVRSMRRQSEWLKGGYNLKNAFAICNISTCG